MEQTCMKYGTAVCNTARKRGKSHIAKDTPCQDYCLCTRTDNGLLLLCAADGHGGDAYIYSDLGSELACTILKDTVSAFPGHQDLSVFTKKAFKEQLLGNWRDAVLAFHGEDSEEAERVLRRYGTTLLFVIANDTDMVVGQIGDGAILLFNDAGCGQLFRRHLPKIGSATSSLVSSRALYSLHTEQYSRSLFPHVLLSTDGIYDKLDSGDVFLRYGMTLLQDVRKHEQLQEPFTIEGIDVYEESRDDCSIALLVSDLPSALTPDTEHRFVRAWDGIGLYEQDGKEIHVLSALPSWDPPVSSLYTLLFPLRKHPCTYSIPKDTVMISELLEANEHLTKKHEDEDDIYTGTYWLGVWLRMKKIREYFRDHQILPEDHLLRTARLSRDGRMYFFADAFGIRPYDETKLDALFDAFLDRFSFIGTLRLHDVMTPLCACTSHSPAFTYRSEEGKQETLCRLVRNPSGSYGLWNISPYPWKIPAQDKTVALNKVLRLTGDITIEIQDERHTLLEAVLFERKGEETC